MGNATSNIPKSKLSILVTGADTGFGKELVLTLATIGHTVYAGCLTLEGIQQFENTENIKGLQFDVINQEQIANMVEKLPKNLYALICNAGVVSGHLFDLSSLQDYHKEMDVNYFGTIGCIKACLPLLRGWNRDSSLKSRIIIMSSSSAFYPMETYSGYSASKAALWAFAEAIRYELLWDEIHVTTIHPGGHKTPMHNLASLRVERLWRNLSIQDKQRYGENFKQKLIEAGEMTTKAPLPPAKNVVDVVIKCTSSLNPPRSVTLGFDTYIFRFVQYLPLSLRSWFQRLATVGSAVPDYVRLPRIAKSSPRI